MVCAGCHTEHNNKGYCKPCSQQLFGLEAKPPEAAETVAPAQLETKSTRGRRAKASKAAEPVELQAPIQKAETEVVVSKPPSGPQTEIVEKPITAISPSSAPSSQKVSNLWWLAPAIFAWLGGLVAWLLNKKAEPKKAKNMLFGGIGMTVLQGIVALIMVFALCVPRAPGQGRGQSVASSIPSSIHTVVVGPDIPAPPAPPKFTLKPLATKTVKPSAEDQSVAGDGKLTVLIPGGTLKNKQEVKISSVANPPELSGGLDYLAAYDITFTKDHDFDKELTLSLTYDAPDESQQPISDADVAAAYWNEADGNWIGVPVSIDRQSGTTKLVVRTTHNGGWAWFKRKVGLSLSEEDEGLFIIDYFTSGLPEDAEKVQRIESQRRDKREQRDDIRKKIGELNDMWNATRNDEGRKRIEAQIGDLNKQLEQLKSEVEALSEQIKGHDKMKLATIHQLRVKASTMITSLHYDLTRISHINS
jgi:hypothetical protein